VRQTQKETF